jgi:hypothetical protein
MTMAHSQSAAMTPEERHEYLAKLQQILPDVPSFRDWLQKTGELPPDFDALPRINGLPEPLQFLDGKAVRTPREWQSRRAEIRRLFEKYDLGTFPPKPKLDRAVVLDETPGKGYLVRNLRLEFGPGSKGTMRVQVMIPDGKGPFPVAPTWPVGLRRCFAAGTSLAGTRATTARMTPPPWRNFIPITISPCCRAGPGPPDWCSIILKPCPMPTCGTSVCSATLATARWRIAAVDERIAAVIAGSTGVGGVLPWRLAGERGFGESIESTTRSFPTWFVPRLRFFAGREDRLPIDGNLLVAMVAPRAALLEYGLNDEVSNSWGDEQAYYSALKVYKFLGQPSRLGILRVPGFHGANDQEACLDWLDIQFGRPRAFGTTSFYFPGTTISGARTVRRASI